MTTLDEQLHIRAAGLFLTDDDKYQICSAIIDAHVTGQGMILRKVELADGYPRGEKVSYRRVDPQAFRLVAE